VRVIITTPKQKTGNPKFSYFVRLVPNANPQAAEKPYRKWDAENGARRAGFVVRRLRHPHSRSPASRPIKNHQPPQTSATRDLMNRPPTPDSPTTKYLRNRSPTFRHPDPQPPEQWSANSPTGQSPNVQMGNTKFPNGDHQIFQT
jgi:hypothetical protein